MNNFLSKALNRFTLYMQCSVYRYARIFVAYTYIPRKFRLKFFLQVVVLNRSKGEEDGSDDTQVLPQTPQVNYFVFSNSFK